MNEVISIDTPATCADCKHFDHEVPNPFTPENGTCDATLDDGLPPFIPAGGIAPNHHACVFFARKNAPDQNI